MKDLRHCTGRPQKLKGRRSSVSKPYDLHIASHLAICRPHLLPFVIAITRTKTGSGGLWALLISAQSLKQDLRGQFSIITICNLGGPCAFLVVGSEGSRQIGTKGSLRMRKWWFLLSFVAQLAWNISEWEKQFWQYKIKYQDQLLFTTVASAFS